jgi:hypothetical protein
MSPVDIIRAMQVAPADCPEAPVYAIVPKNGPVSFYSQQKRAFNLVSALWMENKLADGDEVGVIGAGLAGITAAAAARILGCKVTVFEANEAPFHQQHGNHTRFIHPNVIDWPDDGSKSPETDLPYLNWTAGECASVIDEIEDQWEWLGIQYAKPAIYQVVDFQNDGAYITTTKPYLYNKYKVVIIAVGFGIEDQFGLNQKSYWSDEHWHQLLSTSNKRILVSGTGDGGLIDCMRLVLLKFDQGEILDRVMTHPPLMEIGEQLIDADREARAILAFGSAPLSRETTAKNRANAARLLHSRYNSLGVPDRVPELERRTNYKAVILNGPTPTPLNLNSSVINRVIVHSLIAKGAIEYVSGSLVRFPNDDFHHEVRIDRNAGESPGNSGDIIKISDIDDIIIRHGPLGALHATLLQKAEEAYRSHSEQVDQVGQQEIWRCLQFEIPKNFKPTPKLALLSV